ncbi:MAG: DGQHR domain-containing protein [Dehalococcoidia bacterium]|nr:DGQHR domain-containing protein [Dehalococcoidia bacterium]
MAEDEKSSDYKLRGIKMELLTIKGTNLNTLVYRGFASIKDLASISAPDTGNQDKNPDGLQRDLKEKHARDGYRYAEGAQKVPDYFRLWPEVILNVRDSSVIGILPVDEAHNLFKIVVHEDLIDKNLEHPQISRTDGNHRLFYGEGHPIQGWPPLDISTPFSLTIGLTPLQETSLFVDINDNQVKMNTSHLYHLLARVTESESLARDKPTVWLADKLVKDYKSPFHGIVYLGGEKEKVQGLDRRVSLAHLRTGVEMMLKLSIKLRDYKEIEDKCVIIRTYWSAVAKTFAQEWADPKKYLLLRGWGIWSMSIVGADIIDRCLGPGVIWSQLEDRMAAYLYQIRGTLNWDAKEGDVTGYGGRLGAATLADRMREFLSEEGVDMRILVEGLKSIY